MRLHNDSKSTKMNGDTSSNVVGADPTAAAATVTASAAAVCGGEDARRENSGVVDDGDALSAVVGEEPCLDGLAVSGKRALTYDGEDVLPETWVKVGCWLYEERLPWKLKPTII